MLGRVSHRLPFAAAGDGALEGGGDGGVRGQCPGALAEGAEEPIEVGAVARGALLAERVEAVDRDLQRDHRPDRRGARGPRRQRREDRGRLDVQTLLVDRGERLPAKGGIRDPLGDLPPAPELPPYRRHDPRPVEAQGPDHRDPVSTPKLSRFQPMSAQPCPGGLQRSSAAVAAG